MTKQQPFQNWMPETTPISPCDSGSVSFDKKGPFVAGSYQRFTLTYAAGRYGIDDTGSLKICYRFASDMGRPQFTDPFAPNFVSVVASNGATLDVRFDYKQNTRPWDRTIYVKVVAGFMREGDTVVVSFGADERGPGMRMQTFVDPEFRFRVLVDPIATYTYVDVPDVPILPIVPGPAFKWHAVLPTFRRITDEFSLKLRADDVWGNPTNDWGMDRILLSATGLVDGLPKSVGLSNNIAEVIGGLNCRETGSIRVSLTDSTGILIAESNTLVVGQDNGRRSYWGDLHAQSGETIGSGSIDDYMRFARDYAFLDLIGHQGNDFQITPEFWHKLGAVMAKWNEPGFFVTVPGYEWSGNTSLGGDRNVFYRSESHPIFRSSHALVSDRSDSLTDCWDAHALFTALMPNVKDTVVWAHCGGRYADITYAHDHALERSVEIHSSWGTFEWLAADAFANGYRVGIVANSDGHKGRPGSEPPGASMFGALGGLTCYLMENLSRDALFDALQARHHYATTGSRLHMSLESRFRKPANIWIDDPRVEGARTTMASTAIMGDIVEMNARTVAVEACIVSTAPILSIEVRNGKELLETIRPHASQPLGRRFRIEWSGAEYRGRARQTVWDGSLKVHGAEITDARAINFFNPDRPLRYVSPAQLEWSSITTGNFAGIEIELSDIAATLDISTPLGGLTEYAGAIGHDPVVRSFGKLARELRIYRLPDVLTVTEVTMTKEIHLTAGDNPIWIAASFADGHQAWSSPIYFIPASG